MKLHIKSCTFKDIKPKHAETSFFKGLTRISHQEIWSSARRRENGGGSVPEYAEQTISGTTQQAGNVRRFYTLSIQKSCEFIFKPLFIKSLINSQKIICEKYGLNVLSKIKLALLLPVVLTLLAVGCSSNSTEAEDEERIGFDIPSYGLFLIVGNNANGLYYIDNSSAEAIKVGDGNSGITETAAGLTYTGTARHMTGSNGMVLHQIAMDGSSFSPIGNSTGQPFTEGLAYDPVENVLYASSNGFLYIRDPETGEVLKTVLSPPDQPDIEGMAFDPYSRTLYGLARGSESHPALRRELYIMDVDALDDQPEWQTVGDTGGLWANAGLAINWEKSVLYATGRIDDPGALFRIDPGSGNTTRVGATGLPSAEGGLAWVPAQ
ncbi:hypothetical protein BH23BAC3_BH23BAC3_28220 [soil metagenome]